MNAEEYVIAKHLIGLFKPITENIAISRGKIVLDTTTETLVFVNFMGGNELICHFNSNHTSAVNLKFEFTIEQFLNLREELYQEMDILDIRIQKQDGKWYLLSDELVKRGEGGMYYPPDFFKLIMEGAVK